MYYVLAADARQKAQIRKNLALLGKRVYLDNNMNAILGDGDPSTAIVFTNHYYGMTNCKMLYHVTGTGASERCMRSSAASDMARLGVLRNAG